MDWDKLRVFHAVASAGSLTHSGETLNLSQSAVSRQIKSLEDDLKTPLFHRHARGLSLTEQGEKLFESTTLMDQQVRLGEARVKDAQDDTTGELRVTTTVGFGTIWLAPRLNRFITAHPNLSVDLILTERVLDLSTREADIAIRMRPPLQADLIRKPILNITLGIYASEAYLDSHTPIEKPQDLLDHRILVYSPSIPQSEPAMAWLSSLVGGTLKTTLSVNNYFGVLQAASHAVGVSILPSYMADTQPNLVRIFPDVHSPGHKSYLVYAEEIRNLNRIKLFRDFIVTELAQDKN